MTLVLVVGAFLFLMASISYYGYVTYVRPAQIYQHMGSDAGVADIELITRGSSTTRSFLVVEKLGDQIPVDISSRRQAERYLIAAGIRSPGAPSMYFGIRVVLCVLMVMAAFFARDFITFNPILRFVLLIAAGLIGYGAPSLYLDYLVGKRQEALKFALPDALDLAVVCVEAGLGLDQALQAVARELHDTHPDLSDELALVNLEMRAGRSRADALRNFAKRTGEPGVRKLVSILIQADRFGTSMADSLRAHSEFMRVRRRQEAEERANKVGVKLVFPIFFCILPAMLVVAAGPGVLQVVKYLFPMMRSIKL